MNAFVMHKRRTLKGWKNTAQGVSPGLKTYAVRRIGTPKPAGEEAARPTRGVETNNKENKKHVCIKKTIAVR